MNHESKALQATITCAFGELNVTRDTLLEIVFDLILP